MAILTAAWLIPGAATAGTFVWIADANGLWTDTAKWKYEPGSGPFGAGYPTSPGDVAILGDESTMFSGARTITIPDNVHITAGVIGMKSGVGFKVVPGGANSRIDLDNGQAIAVIYKQNPSATPDEIAVPIRLLSRLTVTVTPPAGSITLPGTIGEAGAARSLAKFGSGTLYLQSAGNAFTGPTTVDGGLLVLSGTGAPTNIYEKVAVSVGEQSTYILNGDQVLASLAVGSGALVDIGVTKEVGPRTRTSRSPAAAWSFATTAA